MRQHILLGFVYKSRNQKEVPEDSALLFSFSAQRDSGQRDPPSFIHFVDDDKIIATALRMLDDQIGDPTWVGGEDNGVYAKNNNCYTDDSLCGGNSAQVIQKRMPSHLRLHHFWSSRKTSLLLFNFLQNRSLATTTPMTVHTIAWIPPAIEGKP